MLPRRSVPGSLVSLRGFVIKAIGDATMGTANRTWSPAAIVSVSVSSRWARVMCPLSRQVPARNRPGIGLHALRERRDLSLDISISYESLHRCSPGVVAAGAIRDEPSARGGFLPAR